MKSLKHSLGVLGFQVLPSGHQDLGAWNLRPSDLKSGTFGPGNLILVAFLMPFRLVTNLLRTYSWQFHTRTQKWVKCFLSFHFTTIRKSCSYARIFAAKDYNDQAKLSADEILRLGVSSYTTTSFLLPASEILTAECPPTGHLKKVFPSPLVRAQYSPASNDIEVVSWWWLGVPTTWLPPPPHHHTASENITSYTPTPSTSDGLTGDLFLEIFSEEREKMIYC